jgi:hypothetical protein
VSTVPYVIDDIVGEVEMLQVLGSHQDTICQYVPYIIDDIVGEVEMLQVLGSHQDPVG